MLLAGAGHPMLLANLYVFSFAPRRSDARRPARYRQIANIFEAKALPASRQPRTLHVTGPFTLGHTLCDPFHFVEAATLFGGAPPPGLAAAAAAIADNCEKGMFRGRPARDPGPGDPDWTHPSGDWALTYGAGSALSFRFDGCRGQWHRPGNHMPYQAVLAAMNVTHHLKITA